MSYQSMHPLRGLGAWGVASAADTCAGAQMSEPDGDKCCPMSTWNNGTYLLLKGVWSRRYHSEKRVRVALRLLLGADGDGLSQAAWDLGATEPVPVTLKSAVQRAAHNFLAIRPPDRWKKKSQGVKTHCTDRGWYSTWTIQSPTVTDERVAALQDALGSPLPAPFVAALRQSGRWNFELPEKPQALDTWQRHELQMMEQVPGGAAGRSIDSVPQLTGDLVVRAGATIGPSTWLRSFLSYYAPGWEKKTAAVITTKLTTMPQIKAGAFSYSPTVNQALWEPEPPIYDEERPGLGTGAKVAIGIAAAAVVGVGAWQFRKK